MFGDWGWNEHRSSIQEQRYIKFKKNHINNKLLLIQIGCGTAIPTIRNEL